MSEAEIRQLTMRVAALERKAGVSGTALLLTCEECQFEVVELRTTMSDDNVCARCGCRSLYPTRRIAWPPEAQWPRAVAA